MTAADWPSVDWPMNIMTGNQTDPDDWTGEGDWGEYWIGVGGTCVDRSPPAGYASSMFYISCPPFVLLP